LKHGQCNILELVCAGELAAFRDVQEFDRIPGEPVMDALGTVDRVIAVVKRLRELSQKLHDAELHSLIADLVSESADLKLKLAEMRSENLQLREKVDELEHKVDVRSKVELRDGFYYLTQSIQGYSEDPFCATCLDTEGILVTLRRTYTQNFRTKQVTPSGWRCSHCAHKRPK